MKNILIPTTLEADTVTAVRTAIKQAHGQNCAVILMLPNEPEDTYSSLDLLRQHRQELTQGQTLILNRCRLLTQSSDNCRLEVHYQLGLSAPLIKNLITAMGIGLIIFSPSYKGEQAKLHQYCRQLLLNSKSHILHLCENAAEADLTKALYLENETTKLDVQELQQLLSGRFTFKIVSQATITEEQNHEDLAPLLADAISKNNIGLLVQTRKAEKRKHKNTKTIVTDAFGLPVLSVYEGVV
jgi:hypothetical protein